MTDIAPYVGIGKLHLGMTSGDVGSLFGHPIRREEKKGREIYVYGDCRLNFSEMNLLDEIELFSNHPVTYKGKSVFQCKGVLEEMIKDDGNPSDIYGTVLLLKLGITFWGFDEVEPEVKAISLFRKGYWDSYKNKAKVLDVHELLKSISNY